MQKFAIVFATLFSLITIASPTKAAPTFLDEDDAINDDIFAGHNDAQVSIVGDDVIEGDGQLADILQNKDVS